jgi:hypothetical protein
LDVTRFDTVARALGQQISRRGALRTGSGVLAAALVGGAARTQTVLAAPDPPPPPYNGTPGTEWPVCSEERPDYCIARFEVGSVNQLNTPAPEFQAQAMSMLIGPGSTEVNRVDFKVDPLTNADAGREVLLAIRTGRLKLTNGAIWGRGGFVAVSGNDEDGWEATITGRVALVQLGGPPDPEQATHAKSGFSGILHDLRRENPGYWDGQYVTNNAMSATSPMWVDGGWVVNLWAPHYAVPGTTPDGLTHGSYSAWMSPQNVQAMDLTVEQALAGQLAVTRTDAGVTAPVAAAVTQRAGGVFIDIPDLTFSEPTLRFAKADGSGHQKKRKKSKKGKKGKKGKKKGRK